MDGKKSDRLESFLARPWICSRSSDNLSLETKRQQADTCAESGSGRQTKGDQRQSMHPCS